MQTYYQVCTFIFDQRSTQVDANNHNRPVFWRSMSAGSPFLKHSFLTVSQFPKKFRRGELDVREPSPFPLDSRLYSGSCFILQLSPREH